MITYKFNKEIGILETFIKEVVSIKDFIEYIISISEDQSLPDVLKIYTDASEGRFSSEVKPEDLPKIVEVNNLHLAKRKRIIDAFTLSGSMETALGQLYMELSKADNYKFKIFSTKDAAIVWLNNF